jgi:hypothetical protein
MKTLVDPQKKRNPHAAASAPRQRKGNGEREAATSQAPRKSNSSTSGLSFRPRRFMHFAPLVRIEATSVSSTRI